MIILLGSESAQKKEVLRSALWELLACGLEVVPFPAASSVADQPLDTATTVRGSRNRALDAAARYEGKFDFSFGMEGGLELVDGLYHLVCAVTVLDCEGRMETGMSALRSLPLAVSESVGAGRSFGRAMRAHAAQLSDQEEKRKAAELIDRTQPFTEAIRAAWKEFRFNP
jgi:non-canonical (house-cleaning) NTP pyrophosphatase